MENNHGHPKVLSKIMEVQIIRNILFRTWEKQQHFEKLGAKDHLITTQKNSKHQ